MENGDFVKIEFVGRVKDTGEIFDLTDEALAKKEGIFEKEHKYGPALVIVGARSVVPGVEAEIRKLKVGEEKEFVVVPDDGFGKRDPKNIQIVSINKFVKERINPIPGAFVNIDGRNCRIQSVSGGRVRVDFNHPLSGKELLYSVKLVGEVKGAKERVDSMLAYFDVKGEAAIEGEKAKIRLEKPNHLLEKVISESVKKWVKEIKDVEFEGKDDKAEHAHKEGENHAHEEADKV